GGRGGRGLVPAKRPALEDRMQRIDENEAARQIETACPAALAKAADQIVLGQAGQALANQPVDQVQSGRQLHTPLCRVIMPDERFCGTTPRTHRTMAM